jgi:hypothetical protein
MRSTENFWTGHAVPRKSQKPQAVCLGLFYFPNRKRIFGAVGTTFVPIISFAFIRRKIKTARTIDFTVFFRHPTSWHLLS